MATHAERQAALVLMRSAADDIAAAVEGLSAQQLTARYIATEWTVAQNVHHMPDSHSFMWNNVRLALTEDRPTWKGYSPDAIALLPDAQATDLTDSLILFRTMQNRIIRLYESLSDAQYARVGIGARGERSVDELLQIYAGHARSHVKQIADTLAAGK
ncbi:MAG: hypothetical protein RLZZ297_17 [Chloroflexota bacterium]|jgi:hypothetical protein